MEPSPKEALITKSLSHFLKSLALNCEIESLHATRNTAESVNKKGKVRTLSFNKRGTLWAQSTTEQGNEQRSFNNKDDFQNPFAKVNRELCLSSTLGQQKPQVMYDDIEKPEDPP